MKARVWNDSAICKETLGAGVIELEFLDGRQIQVSASISTDGSRESGLMLIRVWPAGGVDVHGNITSMSMSFHISPETGAVEIRELQTSSKGHVAG